MKILLADDHDLIRDTIALLLKQLDPELQALHAATLSQTLDVARKNEDIRVIIIDLHMPGMNGLADLKAVQVARPEVPVVICSGDDDPKTMRNALQSGATGFLPKTIRGQTMLRALQLILSGDRYVPEAAISGAGAASGSSARGEGGFPSLSDREREVLRLLVGGLTNKEIGQGLEIEPVTVAGHLRAIYRKLNVKSRTQAVRRALEEGWGG
jgi:DNA-binding NarL/FixJ family response regulator